MQAEGPRPEVSAIAGRYIDEAQARAIRSIPHFAQGRYRDIDFNGAIDFYLRRYTRSLGAFLAWRRRCGCRYRRRLWLAFHRFRTGTEARVIAVDSGTSHG